MYSPSIFPKRKPELLEKVLTANRQKALNAQSRKVAESKDNAHSTRSNVSLPGVENVPPISVLFGTCKELGETPGMLDNPKRGQKHGRCEASLFGNERSPQPNTSSNRAGTDNTNRCKVETNACAKTIQDSTVNFASLSFQCPFKRGPWLCHLGVQLQNSQ